MSRAWSVLLLVLGGVAVAQPGAQAAMGSEPLPPTPFAIMAKLDSMAVQLLWPGFDLGLIPIAIYDGEQTVLFRHPRPPAGFVPSPAYPGAWVAKGLHEEVRANTAAKINDVLTAVVMLNLARDCPTPAYYGAVVAHEAFHVYELTRHPDWSTNEAELFTYPVEDVDLLSQRRMETEALRRAVQAGASRDRRAWAKAAMRIRDGRYARLGEGGRGYERGTERFEGLAEFVQTRALGTTERLLHLTPEEFPADAVRLRSYATGLAIALLLDEVDPAWKTRLESGSPLSTDEMLTAALVDVEPAEFSAGEWEKARTTARDDGAALMAKRGQTRDGFLAREGWSVIVVADSEEPLGLRMFDPMNVQRLSDQEVLHTRWLRLASDAGSLEVLDRPCLTTAAGPHPLFTGVARLTATGLAKEPQVTESERQTTIRAEGFSAEFVNANVEREGRVLTLTLGVKPGR